MHLLQSFAYPTWLPIAPAIQVSLTTMACDDISPAKFCFCYLKALPFVFLTLILPGLLVMMQNRSFEWRGSEILLADVSSVLEFESRPEVVDFARLCCGVLLLLGQLRSAPKQPGSRMPDGASKPSKWPNYFKGTHCSMLRAAHNDRFVDPPCKLLLSWQLPEMYLFRFVVILGERRVHVRTTKCHLVIISSPLIYLLNGAYTGIFAYCDVISLTVFKCVISLVSVQHKLKGYVSQ